GHRLGRGAVAHAGPGPPPVAGPRRQRRPARHHAGRTAAAPDELAARRGGAPAVARAGRGVLRRAHARRRDPGAPGHPGRGRGHLGLGPGRVQPYGPMTAPGREVVAVVVVTYHSEPLLADLVASLPAGLAGLEWHLTVADNGSTDATVPTLRRLAPEATVVEMGANRGYAAG